MMSTEALRTLAAVAETQDGLVTAAQAARVGVLRLNLSRLTSSGDLERVVHGVYRVRGAAADSLTELRAVWLAQQPDRTASERVADRQGSVVVSHRSAAAVHRIGNVYADHHELTSPHRKQTSRERVIIHRAELGHGDVTITQGMLVTSTERTIADLALTEPNLTDVADALADAYERGEVDLEAVALRLDASAKRHGAANGEDLLERMLEYRSLDATSALRALVAAPAAVRQLASISHDVFGASGLAEAFKPLNAQLAAAARATGMMEAASASIADAIRASGALDAVSARFAEAARATGMMEAASASIADAMRASGALESINASLASAINWDAVLEQMKPSVAEPGGVVAKDSIAHLARRAAEQGGLTHD